MATLKVGKSLQDTDMLWRYMSLDKFIDLVESKTLFFAPLAWFEKTDPFEGYLPQVCMEAVASISRKFRDEHIGSVQKLAQLLPKSAGPQIEKLREDCEMHLPTMKALHKNISACLMVNCWYRSNHESEGMWGLYSRSGVAIRTSVKSLKTAILKDEKSPVIHMGAIKYIDFSDEKLKPSDCVTVDGHLMGMVKRIAYSHENEVRMYITGEREKGNLELKKPASTRISFDLESLLEAVVISPFAGASLDRSVRAICRWSGVKENIVSKSTLLDNCEYLLNAYN
ncbi:DUF2971 domain-containing protein [Herbaspirillum rubrisubalbicans]|uniref:DUF2971 domain-containing protein n=1 Tax=Herbaspirillum rubrisubalbicans TaxID=80842 RepID=UPI000DD30605|nr:DUF2971 domain-containing protein [Herbaspirillum rubrisubalbicans]